MGDAAQPATTSQEQQEKEDQQEQPQQEKPQQEEEKQQQQQQLPPPVVMLQGEELLDAAADMVLGWVGLLGAGAAGRTSAAVRCSMGGLAAAVLLCSSGAGARLMVARGSIVLLDDVLTMPGVSGGERTWPVAAALLRVCPGCCCCCCCAHGCCLL
jgi:hypothetical protein